MNESFTCKPRIFHNEKPQLASITDNNTTILSGALCPVTSRFTLLLICLLVGCSPDNDMTNVIAENGVETGNPQTESTGYRQKNRLTRNAGYLT